MRRPATLLAIAAVLALVPLTWLGIGWLLDVDSEARMGAAPVNESPSPRGVAAPRSSTHAIEDEPGAGRERPTSAAQTTQRAALGDDRVEVQVVERSTGQPLPTAQVRWAPLPGDGTWWEAPAWELDTIDAWMDAHGEPLEVRDGGLVFVPVPTDAAAVLVGEVPGAWGRARIEAEANQPQRLELGPDATVEVRTIDSAGVPRPGIPVALRASREGWAAERLATTTDDQGAAQLRHVGFRMHQERTGAIWSIAAAVLLAESVEERLDPDALPSQPVVLVLPATGALEVAVTATPGGPSLEDGRVEVLRLEAGAAVRPSFWSQPDRVTAPLDAGLARFEHVGVGLELSIEARAKHSTQPTRLQARGPARAGETAQVDLVLGSDHPVLRLRLLDSAGTPLEATPVRAEIEQSTVFSFTSDTDELRTDAAGVLYYDLSPDWVEGGKRELTLTVAPSDALLGGSAALDLARTFPVGLSDLGDVRLAASQLLAAGRVEDATGAPLPGARVQVRIPRGWDEEPSWYDDRPQLGVEAGPDGRFEVIGTAESAKLQLEGTQAGYAGEPVDVPVGTTAVVLRLWSAGSVEGRLLADEGVWLDELRVQLRPVGDENPDHFDRSLRGQADVDGSFALRPVAPGRYDLVVRSRWSSQQLASVEGLSVPAGGPCVDPRLVAIDLRGRLCAFTLELVPPRVGESVSGVVVARPTGVEAGAEQEETRYFQGERVPFAASAPALDLEILAQGFRRVRLEAVQADVRVELEEGLQVRLRLPAAVELPKPPRYLKAFLGSEEDFWSLGHMQDAVFGENRELVLRVAEPGSLLVLWMLEERSEDTILTTSLGSEEPQTLDVRDQRGEQVFDVEPDPEAYARALERWREG